MCAEIPAAALTLAAVRESLLLPHFDAQAARAPMTPESRRLYPPTEARPRQAAVLLLLWPQAAGLHFVLTRRAQDLRGHSGQISLPGGRCDPTDADPAATALRETQEELGISASAVQLLGKLDDIYIPPSNFLVHPHVGALATTPDFRPCAAEVAEVLSVPLARLFDAQRPAHPLVRAGAANASRCGRLTGATCASPGTRWGSRWCGARPPCCSANLRRACALCWPCQPANTSPTSF